MAAESVIGVVTKFIVKSATTTGTDEDTTINTNLIANEEATYQNVDAAMRALMQLSNNTYQDTTCVTNISVAEQMAE